MDKNFDKMLSKSFCILSLSELKMAATYLLTRCKPLLSFCSCCTLFKWEKIHAHE